MNSRMMMAAVPVRRRGLESRIYPIPTTVPGIKRNKEMSSISLSRESFCERLKGNDHRQDPEMGVATEEQGL
jgi:hypothetical protein